MVNLLSDNIYSPLGLSTVENYGAILAGESGIQRVSDTSVSPDPFYASMFGLSDIPLIDGYSRFESLCIASVSKALIDYGISYTDSDTIFILSTTKGNIEYVETENRKHDLVATLSLSQTAQRIASRLSFVKKPIVVSNACISGVLALICAQRLLEAGIYRHAVVCGADVLSKFVISGFQSLHATSEELCRPFDIDRKGINLGECAATMVLSTEAKAKSGITIKAGSLSNDANHISGPSRTGLELSQAVSRCMKDSGIKQSDVSFISAHGTGTIFNDEMESKAFEAAGLSEVPLHSLKGHFGHTLGAAGVLESIVTCYSLGKNEILPSMNCIKPGVSGKVNISSRRASSELRFALKTASGFAGCNAAIAFSRN